MKQTKIVLIQLLCIGMLFITVTYYNIFGMILAILTYYGFQNKNLKILKYMLFPNLLEDIIFMGSIVGCIVLMLVSNINKEKMYFNSIGDYIRFFLLIVQFIIQTYITYNSYIITQTPNETARVNENIMLPNIENTNVLNNNTEEIEPLPAYTPPANILPTYNYTLAGEQRIIDIPESDITESESDMDNQVETNSNNNEQQNTNIPQVNITNNNNNNNNNIIVENNLQTPPPPPYTPYPINF